MALLADAEAVPAVFHCTAGKDRTGIVAELILAVLGVADETIAADYAVTEQTRARSTAWIETHEPDYATGPTRTCSDFGGQAAAYGSSSAPPHAGPEAHTFPAAASNRTQPAKCASPDAT